MSSAADSGFKQLGFKQLGSIRRRRPETEPYSRVEHEAS